MARFLVDRFWSTIALIRSLPHALSGEIVLIIFNSCSVIGGGQENLYQGKTGRRLGLLYAVHSLRIYRHLETISQEGSYTYRNHLWYMFRILF